MGYWKQARERTRYQEPKWLPLFFFFFLERSGHRAGQAGPMQRAAMYVCVRRNATQLESEREKEERK